MAFSLVGVGSAANDGTGDALRTAFQTINANFTAINSGTEPGAFTTLTASGLATLNSLRIGDASQFSAPASVRGAGATSLEWGHPNTSGYGSSLGYEGGSGWSFLAFNASAGTTNSTYRTYGFPGRILKSGSSGQLFIGRAVAASADNQAFTTDVTVDGSGNVGIGTTGPDYLAHINGALGIAPGSSVTPANNGDVVFEATNNTTLTVKLKGSDGTVRSGTVTLS